ncbi:hypothetical protein ACLB2K_000563 [Fragaria x ananassa]
MIMRFIVLIIRLQNMEQPREPKSSSETENKVKVGQHSFNNYLKVQAEELEAQGIQVKRDKEFKRIVASKWNTLTPTEKAQYCVPIVNESSNITKKRKEQPQSSTTISTRCSPQMFRQVVSKFSGEQTAAITELGFGKLLQLSCTRVRRDLCGFLIGKLDTENCQIELHGKAMEVNSSDFNLIMSVPEGGSDVDLNGSIDDPDMKPLVDYYGGTSGNIQISYLIKKLDGTNPVDDHCSSFIITMSLAMEDQLSIVQSPLLLHGGEENSSRLIKFVRDKGGYDSPRVIVAKLYSFRGQETKSEDVIAIRNEVQSIRDVIARLEIKIDGNPQILQEAMVNVLGGDRYQCVKKKDANTASKVAEPSTNDIVEQNHQEPHARTGNDQFDVNDESSSQIYSEFRSNEAAPPTVKKQHVKSNKIVNETRTSRISPINTRRTDERFPSQAMSSPYVNIGICPATGQSICGGLESAIFAEDRKKLSEFALTAKLTFNYDFRYTVFEKCEKLKTLDIMFEDEIYIFFHERWLFSSFKIFRPGCVPIQPNDFDCGIYIIKFMEDFENASKAGDKFDSETERLRIAMKLVKHPDNQACVAIDKAIEDQEAEDKTIKLPKKRKRKQEDIAPIDNDIVLRTNQANNDDIFFTQSEDIFSGAIREVKEETGIETTFLKMVAFRHAHKVAFEQSDLLFVCMLKPLSSEITIDGKEIQAAKWMPLDEFIEQPYYEDDHLSNKVIDLCIAAHEDNYSGFTGHQLNSKIDGKLSYLYCDNVN